MNAPHGRSEGAFTPLGGAGAQRRRGAHTNAPHGRSEGAFTPLGGAGAQRRGGLTT